jgi:hypothetical protein
MSEQRASGVKLRESNLVFRRPVMSLPVGMWDAAEPDEDAPE